MYQIRDGGLRDYQKINTSKEDGKLNVAIAGNRRLMQELTESFKSLLIETAQHLKGHQRRRFMALTVQEWGKGGQRLAERELGWNRDLS